MRRVCLSVALALLPGPLWGQAVGECRLCAPAPAARTDDRPVRPIRIEVETALDFSRIAQSTGQGGQVSVDAQTGARRVAGGLVDLGGMPVRGIVRVTGEPGRAIRIDLPPRVQLRSLSGGIAEVTDLRTDLSGPPMLGRDGALTFAFGGRLTVSGQISGVFRGRIPITAEYQ